MYVNIETSLFYGTIYINIYWLNTQPLDASDFNIFKNLLSLGCAIDIYPKNNGKIDITVSFPGIF